MKTDFGDVTLSRNNNFDIIRLMAAIQVAFFHAAVHLEVPIPVIIDKCLRQFPGVPVFFFLSGLLVTSSLSRSSWRRYAISRARRVLPAMWVAFALAVLILIAFDQIGSGEITSISFWLWVGSQVTVFQFYNPEMFRDFGVGVVNGSLWTIPVEIGFYIILPIIVWLARGRRNPLTAILLVGCFGSFALYEITRGAETTLIKLLGFSPAAHFWFFGIGALTYLHFNKVMSRFSILRKWRYGWLLPLLIYCAYFTLIQPYLSTTFATLIGTVVLASSVFSAGLLAPPKPGILHGYDISYGLYLYHMLVINAAIAIGLTGLSSLILTLAVSVALAAISWRFVEQPILSRAIRIRTRG